MVRKLCWLRVGVAIKKTFKQSLIHRRIFDDTDAIVGFAIITTATTTSITTSNNGTSTNNLFALLNNVATTGRD